MPIYEYRCQQCAHSLEILQKISDLPLTTCPACGKEGLHQLVSAPMFQLKGTGWYETDFKSKPAAISGVDKETRKETAATNPESSTAAGGTEA